MSERQYLFEARKIQKHFSGVRALNDGNLYIEEGKICGLLGANGSGKTTLSKIISGIIHPDNGKLKLNNKEIQIKNPLHAKSIGIAMIHQHLSLVPELSVWQNISLGHEPKNKAGFLDKDKAMEIAEKTIKLLSENISIFAKVRELSPSQKQLVEIAKALSLDPKLLIFDEPTSSLELEEVEKLFSVMNDLKKKNVSMIFISHRMWEVLKICDYVTVFRNGDSVGLIDFEKDGKNEKKIVSLITGKEMEAAACEENRIVNTKKTVETAFKIRGLHLGSVLKNVNLEIKKGEIIGISGLQGQGQEELLLCLSGLFPYDKGELLLNEKNIKLHHPNDAIKNGIVLVPGDRNEEGLFTQHNMIINLQFPQLVLNKSSFIIDSKKMREESKSLIEKMAIVPKDEKKIVRFLSGGNQQKIVVGKWLNLSPKILLLSDPAKGVDVNAKEELYKIVKELSDYGTSVILYASDNKELISICDRIIVMFEGSIVEELDNENLTDEALTAHSLRARFMKCNPEN